jgi:hypothetical protein
MRSYSPVGMRPGQVVCTGAAVSITLPCHRHSMEGYSIVGYELTEKKTWKKSY